MVIQEQDNSEEDSLQVNKSFEEKTSHQNQNIENERQKEPINSPPMLEQPSTSTSTPPFPEILQIDSGMKNILCCLIMIS